MGEEEGLLGSLYFVDNSMVPLEEATLDLNADGAQFTDAGVGTVIGPPAESGSDALLSAGLG